jgi:WD40 repeat protein
VHRDGVLFAAFNSDNTRVVTAGEDFRAIVWDIAIGKAAIPSLEHQEKVLTAAFSQDARRIVTACYDRTIRVWNAQTGDPLTPTLHHIAPFSKAMFLPDGGQIATTDGIGNSSIWKLPFDKKPVEDLIMLARLLSGNSVTPAGQLSPPESKSLLPIWHRLKTTYPSSFATSTDEIAAWHEYQAEDCEMQHQWFAAAFHLERLMAIRNGEQPLADRLAVVKEHLSAR